jgi:hypothetical protein
MIRYFLVTYATPLGYGNLCMSGMRFPSQEFVKEYVTEQTGTAPVVVVHVFEFKSKEDFDDFQRK